MTTAAEDLLVDVENHDGLEVYKDNWPVAEELVAAVTRVLLEGGHDRPSCREHMTYPATVNGVDQVVGLEPVTQPRHVAAARLWAVRS